MYHIEEDQEYPTDGLPVRSRTSQRRYQPTQQTRRIPRTDDCYDEEPITQRPLTRSSVPARATAGHPRTQQYRQPVEQPVQRQRVYSPPPAQLTRRPVQPAQPMSRRSFLGITRKGLFQCAAVIGGASVLGLGLWVRSDYIHVQGQLEEGQYAATTFSLLCGHNDNYANKTQLHAYLQPDGKINFIELPGNNPSKAHLNQTQSVRETGYSGDLADLYLTINPEPVGDHKYQIRLHVEMHEVGILPGAYSQDWMLVDNGKGYFQVVNTK